MSVKGQNKNKNILFFKKKARWEDGSVIKASGAQVGEPEYRS